MDICVKNPCSGWYVWIEPEEYEKILENIIEFGTGDEQNEFEGLTAYEVLVELSKDDDRLSDLWFC